VLYKYSVSLGAFGLQRDRFCEYGEPRSLEERIKIATSIEGLDGISTAYRLSTDVDSLKETLAKYQLGFSHFTVDLSRDRRWLNGSLTSTDPDVRKAAVEHIKNCMDATKKMGGSLVNLCPMGDGYDYLFQTDYSKAWRWLIDGLKEACSYDPDVKIAIEYKKKEPRTHVFVSDVGKALYICEMVKAENLGVTVDFGHSLLAGENPAESICIAAQADRLFSVHLNDNFKDWDWDMLPASTNFWQFIEALISMVKVGYEGWIYMDIYPFRLDPVKAISQSIKNVKTFIKAIQEVEIEKVKLAMRTHDYLKALKMILEKSSFD